MSDIVTAEDAKLKFRILVGMLVRKGDIKRAHADMCNCSNIIFRELYLELMKTASGIKRNHQKAVVADLGAWVLWTIYKDTAYNPIMLYTMKKMLKKQKVLDALNTMAVDNIEDLYVNRWVATKKATDVQQKKDEISRFDMSQSERTFVPSYQHQKHMGMNDEEFKKYMLKRADEEYKKHFRKT